MRLIDHLVLPVTTLTLARSRLTSLGFTVAPDARHPFGTGNCCVFFAERNYLEPVTILDRNAADLAAAEGQFFVRRIKRFTERQGEGFAMVALKSTDAAADHEGFTRAGIGVGLTRFGRAATLPDGSERQIGFVVANSEAPAAPDATFFTIQHLAEDVLFQPAYLDHPNGATGVAAVAAVAENPAEFQELLSEVAGDVPMGDGVSRQGILILSPAEFRDRYRLEPPEARRGLLFAAFEVFVADLDRATGYAGPTARRHGESIVIPPSPGLGAAVAFRTRENG